MRDDSKLNRRHFLAGTLSGLAGAQLMAANYSQVFAASGEKSMADYPGRGHIYKAVKWGMIEGDLTVLEKFQLCKELGYDGMELDSPIDVTSKEIRAASTTTQMPVHGLVDAKHWKLRLSSPDEKVRDAGREVLEQAILDCNAFGGSSVLLVPGEVVGSEENHDHVWQRSIAEIRKVLPVAGRHGIQVLIENVWNGFCETPDQLRDYLDEIDSPLVGSYFDIGNAQKFAPSQDWIRALGSRIMKLDVKGWGLGMPSRGFCKIGDGTIDWLEVRKALAEIGYTGWCTAEVSGGDRERLADIAARVDNVLGL